MEPFFNDNFVKKKKFVDFVNSAYARETLLKKKKKPKAWDVDACFSALSNEGQMVILIYKIYVCIHVWPSPLILALINFQTSTSTFASPNVKHK